MSYPYHVHVVVIFVLLVYNICQFPATLYFMCKYASIVLSDISKVKVKTYSKVTAAYNGGKSQDFSHLRQNMLIKLQYYFSEMC